jgi:hypothetical protein
MTKTEKKNNNKFKMKKHLILLLVITLFHNSCIAQNIVAENKNENHRDGEEYVLLSPAGKVLKSFKGIKVYGNTNSGNVVSERKSTEDLICGLDIKTNKMGYLSTKTGEWVIQPQFENAPYVHDFFDGLSVIEKQIEVGNDQFAVIDKTGKIIVPFCDWTIYDYSDGLAIVEKEGYQFGAIDKTGKLVIPFSVGRLYDFNNGLAIKNNNSEYVNEDYDPTGLWGFMDKTGNMVIPQEWFWAEPFYEDLAAVKGKNGKYGFIDKTGKLVIDCNFIHVKNFSEGFAAISIPSNKDNLFEMTFIDKTGYQATRKQFSLVQDFKEGLASVAKIENYNQDNEVYKFGFVDKNFNVVIPMQHDRFFSNLSYQHFSFSEGLCPTSKGFINKKGKLVISFAPYSAMNIDSFQNGRALVKLYDSKTDTYRSKLIDKSGKILWQSVPNINR